MPTEKIVYKLMQENLVIVESPAKAKKIEEFLGKDYKVMSSYGHIRDLKKKELSINEKTMEPDYEIPEEKKKLVTELKTNAKKAKKIWLASAREKPSAGTFAKYWDWMRRRQTVLSSTRLPNRLFLTQSRTHAIWT